MNFRANLLFLFASLFASLSGAVASADSAADLPRFIGVTRASHDIQLALPVEGLVTAIQVQEGQRVEQGESLLHLDSQLQEAEARRRELIKNDHAHIKTLQHNLVIVKSLVEASRQLFGESGSISEEEVKKLEIQYATMDGELQSLLAQKKREAVEYESALQDLQRRTLRAPRAGIVSEILVEAGEWTTPQQAVIRLVDPRQCHLELNIEERFARQFKTGDTLPVYMAAAAGEQQIDGQIVFVSPIADQASGLVRIKIGFDNQQGEVWPGLPAAVHLPGVVATQSDPLPDQSINDESSAASALTSEGSADESAEESARIAAGDLDAR